MFFVPVAVVLTQDYLVVGKEPNYAGTVRLVGEGKLEQTFVSKVDNLSGLAIKFKNPTLRSNDIVTTDLLYNGETLRTVSLSGVNFPDDGFVKIFFEPIFESKGKEFVVRIFFKNENPSNALEVVLTNENFYHDGELFIDGERSYFNLSFLQINKIFPKSMFFRQIFLDFVSKLGKDKGFIIFYSCVISFLAILYLVYWKKDK